jgi:aerobic-type carbon monoxide dehydrogenase small subunit (CoxS/CutS family)
VRDTFCINGKTTELTFDGGDTLLRLLRENGWTEVKEGCDAGECGACLVLLDGVPVNACQVFAATAAHREIVTGAGIAAAWRRQTATSSSGHARLHPLQRAFVETGAVQCGFCTPGMIIAAYHLLERSTDPTDEEIRTALDGNLCRCTGYVKILDAVRLAAERTAGAPGARGARGAHGARGANGASAGTGGAYAGAGAEDAHAEGGPTPDPACADHGTPSEEAHS